MANRKAPNLVQGERRYPFPIRLPKRWRGWSQRKARQRLPSSPHLLTGPTLGSPSLPAQMRVLSYPSLSLLEMGTLQVATVDGSCKVTKLQLTELG